KTAITPALPWRKSSHSREGNLPLAFSLITTQMSPLPLGRGDICVAGSLWRGLPGEVKHVVQQAALGPVKPVAVHIQVHGAAAVKVYCVLAAEGQHDLRKGGKVGVGLHQHHGPVRTDARAHALRVSRGDAIAE